MERITSRQNPLITRLRRLGAEKKARRAEGVFLCEGSKLVGEALRWGPPPELLVVAEGTVPPAELPAGVRVVEVPEALLLDGVQDPGNVGTVWRTADAFGAAGMFLLPGCAEPFAPKTVRATMGACFRLPVWEGTLEELTGRLAQSGAPLYATALRADTEDLRSVPLGSAAVVIGSEGRGVSQPVLDACRTTLKIPMRDRCESLNAAVAASVVLWEGWR